MIVFDQLWAFVLLPLPLLIAWLTRAYETRREALRAPVFERLVALSDTQPGRAGLILKRNRYQQLVAALAWVLIVTALAAPQWLGNPIVEKRPARDLMLAVDLSASMETEDFRLNGHEPVTRLAGVKQVLEQFVRQRKDDRLGLIVFGNAPYLQVPFTLDHTLFLRLLQETQPRMAGPKTMLGDTIGLGVKHFASSTRREKVLILLTDGNDSGSLVPPLEAARVARNENIVIHTIATGDATATDAQALDLETLRGISELTGGVFFHAEQGEQLTAVYQRLNQLEPQALDVFSYRPRTALYHWPLGMAIGVQLLFQLLIAVISTRRLIEAGAES